MIPVSNFFQDVNRILRTYPSRLKKRTGWFCFPFIALLGKILKPLRRAHRIPRVTYHLYVPPVTFPILLLPPTPYPRTLLIAHFSFPLHPQLCQTVASAKQ